MKKEFAYLYSINSLFGMLAALSGNMGNYVTADETGKATVHYQKIAKALLPDGIVGEIDKKQTINYYSLLRDAKGNIQGKKSNRLEMAFYNYLCENSFEKIEELERCAFKFIEELNLDNITLHKLREEIINPYFLGYRFIKSKNDYYSAITAYGFFDILKEGEGGKAVKKFNDVPIKIISGKKEVFEYFQNNNEDEKFLKKIDDGQYGFAFHNVDTIEKEIWFLEEIYRRLVKLMREKDILIYFKGSSTVQLQMGLDEINVENKEGYERWQYNIYDRTYENIYRDRYLTIKDDKAAIAKIIVCSLCIAKIEEYIDEIFPGELELDNSPDFIRNDTYKADYKNQMQETENKINEIFDLLRNQFPIADNLPIKSSFSLEEVILRLIDAHEKANRGLEIDYLIQLHDQDITLFDDKSQYCYLNYFIFLLLDEMNEENKAKLLTEIKDFYVLLEICYNHIRKNINNATVTEKKYCGEATYLYGELILQERKFNKEKDIRNIFNVLDRLEFDIVRIYRLKANFLMDLAFVVPDDSDLFYRSSVKAEKEEIKRYLSALLWYEDAVKAGDLKSWILLIKACNQLLKVDISFKEQAESDILKLSEDIYLNGTINENLSYSEKCFKSVSGIINSYIDLNIEAFANEVFDDGAETERDCGCQDVFFVLGDNDKSYYFMESLDTCNAEIYFLSDNFDELLKKGYDYKNSALEYIKCENYSEMVEALMQKIVKESNDKKDMKQNNGTEQKDDIIRKTHFVLFDDDTNNNLHFAYDIIKRLYIVEADLRKEDSFFRVWNYADIVFGTDNINIRLLIDSKMNELTDFTLPINYVSYNTEAARALVLKYPLFLPCIQKGNYSRNVVILGGGSCFSEIFRTIIEVSMFDRIKSDSSGDKHAQGELVERQLADNFNLTIIDKNASLLEEQMRYQYPELFKGHAYIHVRPVFITMDITKSAFWDCIESYPDDLHDNMRDICNIVNAANYFVLLTENGIEMGMRLRTALLKKDLTFSNRPFISVYSADEVGARVNDFAIGNRTTSWNWFDNWEINVFGEYKECFSYKNLFKNPINEMAVEMHKKYYADDIDAALKDYYSNNYNRESSLSAALYFIYRMYSSGCFDKLDEYRVNRIFSLGSLEEMKKRYQEEIEKNEESVEQLSIQEHARWVLWMALEGYSNATKTQMSAWIERGYQNHQFHLCKLHPYIANWDELGDGEVSVSVDVERLKNSYNELQEKFEKLKNTYQDYLELSQKRMIKYLHIKQKKDHNGLYEAIQEKLVKEGVAEIAGVFFEKVRMVEIQIEKILGFYEDIIIKIGEFLNNDSYFDIANMRAPFVAERQVLLESCKNADTDKEDEFSNAGKSIFTELEGELLWLIQLSVKKKPGIADKDDNYLYEKLIKNGTARDSISLEKMGKTLEAFIRNIAMQTDTVNGSGIQKWIIRLQKFTELKIKKQSIKEIDRDTVRQMPTIMTKAFSLTEPEKEQSLEREEY